ncbi:hypothetical protein RHGRI_033165 [Rhododendron griersonianum]|uniref:Uncharacterized protein n=1 Tax=Rhododendron griersonianum TaxID=479676 RepID=A0AAV6HW67_9ERIC|nr:hypothetical protein RHGRI_033165 [Rhododendron griersonianum]
MEIPKEMKMPAEMGIRENMMVVVVVEYLGDSMSKDLLGKFPDYSAFDFDYSQSSLWSPLRKLAYRGDDEEDEKEEEHEGLVLVDALKKATVDLKKKITTGTHVFHDKIRMLKQRRKKKKQKAAFDFSPAPVSSPTPRKEDTCDTVIQTQMYSMGADPIRMGWNKLLKVASKRFKKATKKKDPTSHKRLSYPIV